MSVCVCLYVHKLLKKKYILNIYKKKYTLAVRVFDWTSVVTNNYSSVVFKQKFHLHKASIVMQVFSNNMHESKLSVVQSSESKLSVNNQGNLLFTNGQTAVHNYLYQM